MNSISCLNLTSGGVVKYNNVHEFMTIRKTCFLISQFKIVVNYINKQYKYVEWAMRDNINISLLPKSDQNIDKIKEN